MNTPANEIDRQYGHNSANAIPHADLIRAVLDGKTVQYRAEHPEWTTLLRMPALRMMLVHPEWSYRLKPEPVVRWGVVDTLGLAGMPDEETARKLAHRATMGQPTKILRLELDPDTLEIVDARTEAP